MDRAGFDQVRFFKGVEVERNNAHGAPTLFVVGLQAPADIEDYECELPDHIYFGANDSFHPSSSSEVKHWVEMISYFLRQGYVCTLDIPCQYADQVSETTLVSSKLFQAVIKLPIANIERWSRYTFLKLDDVDFSATNQGVWVHSLESLITQESFTAWDKYDGDWS